MRRGVKVPLSPVRLTHLIRRQANDLKPTSFTTPYQRVGWNRTRFGLLIVTVLHLIDTCVSEINQIMFCLLGYENDKSPKPITIREHDISEQTESILWLSWPPTHSNMSLVVIIKFVMYPTFRICFMFGRYCRLCAIVDGWLIDGNRYHTTYQYVK